MTAVPLELRPISAGPYPRVPNEDPYIPHEYYQCGDPEWCLHEEPPDDDEEFFKLIPIPAAESPKIFNTNEFRLASDVPEKLIGIGLPERFANGMALLFHDRIGSTAADDNLVGSFERWGHFESMEDGTLMYYPLTINVRKGMSQKYTNSVIRHEIGHAVRYVGRNFQAREPLYHDAARLGVTRKLGAVGAAGAGLGEVSAVLCHAPWPAAAALANLAFLGSYAAAFPHHTLWLLDSEERFCDRFARRNKQYEFVEAVET